MDNTVTIHNILGLIPHKTPFLFVDEILELDVDRSYGKYTFKMDEHFYKGHFESNPVTPGVILTETMAQIGVLPLGIYQIGAKDASKAIPFLLRTEIDFHHVVYPGNTVYVEGKKRYYRRSILSCEVKMVNDKDELVAEGQILGKIIIE